MFLMSEYFNFTRISKQKYIHLNIFYGTESSPFLGHNCGFNLYCKLIHTCIMSQTDWIFFSFISLCITKLIKTILISVNEYTRRCEIGCTVYIPNGYIIVSCRPLSLFSGRCLRMQILLATWISPNFF